MKEYRPLSGRNILALFFLSLSIINCGSEGEFRDSKANTEFKYQNNIFTRTIRIRASVSFPKPGEPSFSWPATGSKHVVCAVFSERIQVKNNKITNTDQIVWLWHSGLPRGREGNVRFVDGIDPKTEKPPTKPLPPGKYYWGVWALTDRGKVMYSTLEYQFEIK